MVYRAIGLMSGSSLDGLDIAFVEFHENGGKWSFSILEADCYPYTPGWQERLRDATSLSARDYLLLHSAYGQYLGNEVNRFIAEKGLQYKVGLVGSHGHTTFHLPGQRMTAQLGDGAALAAVTQLPVVSDLRSMDVAAGGQGAPIVPVGEKLLFGDYDFYLNIGGIANVSMNNEAFLAFDVCAANRVLNMLAADAGKAYDANGEMAAAGKMDDRLFMALNQLDYYSLPSPKSLANNFGTDLVYPLIKNSGASIPDALHTYCHHIAQQVRNSIEAIKKPGPGRLLVTGGGAKNGFLVGLLSEKLAAIDIETVIPESNIIDYKEAVVMALIAVLRWREEVNVFSSVTGAARDTVGGAMWLG